MFRTPIQQVLLGAVVAAVGLPAGAQAPRDASARLERPDTAEQATEPRHAQPRSIAQTRARQWDLSVSDWQRYKKLLEGIDGYRSEKLDPLTLLGIHARSAAERKRYAEQLARLEHERIERVLAFQNAYDAAFARLYPNAKPVKTDGFGRAMDNGAQAARRLGLESEARTAVFVRTHACRACRRKVEQLAAAGTPMDIFVVDAESDDAIRSWAKTLGLDPNRVRRGEITLNHAPAALARTLAGRSLPRVVSR